MARRKLIAGLIVAAGSIAGALYVRQQRLAAASERVALYFADGTMLELAPEDVGAGELFALGGEILAARPEGERS